MLAGGTLATYQFLLEAVMKDILSTFRNSLESAGVQALDATKREFIRACEDLRKIYGRIWSDRGHL